MYKSRAGRQSLETYILKMLTQSVSTSTDKNKKTEMFVALTKHWSPFFRFSIVIVASKNLLTQSQIFKIRYFIENSMKRTVLLVKRKTAYFSFLSLIISKQKQTEMAQKWTPVLRNSSEKPENPFFCFRLLQKIPNEHAVHRPRRLKTFHFSFIISSEF